MQKLGQIENNFRIFVWVSWNNLNWGRLENNSNISAKQSSSSSYFSSLSAYSFHFFTFSLLVSFHHRRHICSIFTSSPHSFHFFIVPTHHHDLPSKTAFMWRSLGWVMVQSRPNPLLRPPQNILRFTQFFASCNLVSFASKFLDFLQKILPVSVWRTKFCDLLHENLVCSCKF